MYLQPWQIFLGGCACGVFITLLVIVVILLRIAFKGGVIVEHKKEDKDNV